MIPFNKPMILVSNLNTLIPGHNFFIRSSSGGGVGEHSGIGNSKHQDLEMRVTPPVSKEKLQGLQSQGNGIRWDRRGDGSRKVETIQGLCSIEGLYPSYPSASVVKESTCRGRRCGFDPWIKKIPWRRKWHLTPVFLPVPWTEEPDGLYSLGSQIVGQD